MFSLPEIKVINRVTRQEEVEKVFGERSLAFLYGEYWLLLPLSRPFRAVLTKFAFLSSFYGWLQRRPGSRKRVRPFIDQFDIDASEFATPIGEFRTFDDFFTRKIKPECRPIDTRADVAIIPADGRYWFCANIAAAHSFLVKGQRYALKELIQDEPLAARYEGGSMVMARLSPLDCHRYYFPCAGTAGPTELIKGRLGSVNPFAVRKRFQAYTENKRTLCLFKSDQFGTILYVEVGATAVGSIHQTYTPNSRVQKGEEKGYFSFGGSAVILIFEPGRIAFDPDLLEISEQFLEVRCVLGQSMGRAVA